VYWVGRRSRRPRHGREAGGGLAGYGSRPAGARRPGRNRARMT